MKLHEPPLEEHMTASFSLTHLTDGDLLQSLATLVQRDRNTTALLVAHLAEVDARELYLPAACTSMHVYCVRVLHLAEEVAYKRIRGRSVRAPAILRGRFSS